MHSPYGGRCSILKPLPNHLDLFREIENCASSNSKSQYAFCLNADSSEARAAGRGASFAWLWLSMC